MEEIKPVLTWTLFSECEIPKDLDNILTRGERAIAAYKTFRDTAVFTNKRLIVRDVQGVTGKKVEMFSLPYSSIIMWSSENAGHVDINSEMEIWTRIGCIKVCLRRGVNIRRFDKIISTAVLANIKE
ncbi:MAG: PH domain-containing protein [Bacilli bacterium]|nr:PH domain-containing protein [Bacilli bacterium]